MASLESEEHGDKVTKVTLFFPPLLFPSSLWFLTSFIFQYYFSLSFSFFSPPPIQLTFAVRTMTGGTAKFSALVSGNRCTTFRDRHVPFWLRAREYPASGEVEENSARDRATGRMNYTAGVGISWNATARSWVIGLRLASRKGNEGYPVVFAAYRDFGKIEARKI